MSSDAKKPKQPIPVLDRNTGSTLGVLLDKNKRPICLSEEVIKDILENPAPPLRADEIPF